MLANGFSYLSPVDLIHLASELLAVSPSRVRCKLRFLSHFVGSGLTPLRFYCNFSYFVSDSIYSANLSLNDSDLVPLPEFPLETFKILRTDSGFFSNKFWSRGGFATALFYEFTVV